MAKLKKILKKAGKAAAIGAAAYGASKMLGGKDTGINIDKGRGSALSNIYRKRYDDPIMKGGAGVKQGKIGMMDKIKNFLTSPVANTTGGQKTRYFGDTDDAFEFGMGGAKAGGMMYAKNGKYVMAKCKMGKNKKTKIT